MRPRCRVVSWRRSLDEKAPRFRYVPHAYRPIVERFSGFAVVSRSFPLSLAFSLNAPASLDYDDRMHLISELIRLYAEIRYCFIFLFLIYHPPFFCIPQCIFFIIFIINKIVIALYPFPRQFFSSDGILKF